MRKNLLLYINHILESIDLIEIIAFNLSKDELVEDFIRYEAILRRLQVMAESTQKLPQDLKNKYSQIEWKEISAFRNILVHDYLGDISEDTVWFIIREKLPSLKIIILEIQKELELTSDKQEKK